MSDIIDLKKYKLEKGIQDSQVEEESGFVMRKIGEIKETFTRIMSPNLNSFNNIGQDNFKLDQITRKQLSEDIFEKWNKKYKLDFNYRRNIAPNIKIDNNGVFLGNIYWTFDFVFEDSYESGKEELLKFGLKIPSKIDIEESIKYLPGKTQKEKIENLFLILGFNKEYINNIEIFISQDKNLKFNSKTGNLIQKISQKISSLFTENELIEILSLKNEDLFYQEESYKIGTICGIKN